MRTHLFTLALATAAMAALHLHAAPPTVIPSTQGITVNINGAVAWPDDAMTLQTFATADRATTAPHSEGQLGWQEDDQTLWIATGLAAGDWTELLTKAAVGLGSVDNTSDLTKPVSTATQAAIDAVADDILPIASQAEAEAGTATDKLMTPERVAQAIAEQAGGGGTNVDVQTFTTDGTWTKPANAVTVEFIQYGAGSGGASGNSSGSPTGGYGGQPGSIVTGRLPASIFSATESVTVGTGGTGGASVLNNASGAVGGAGGNSTFGPITALGGKASGAYNTAPTATTNGNYIMGSGSNLVAGAAAGAAGASQLNFMLSTPGGGGGSSGTGGAGGPITIASGVYNATGTAAGTLHNNGSDGAARMGGGGGGGGSSANAGNGGNGGFPGGGGGGGGGATDAFSSGTGGVGGAGLVIVITYCAP